MAESKYAKVLGINVHYKICGHGPNTLLLIHGAVGSTNDFILQMADESGLSRDKLTIVAIDLPGYGKSVELPEDMKAEPTMEYFDFSSRVCAELMSHLKLKTYAVGGWSDGARVASLLAIRSQSRVDALLLWGFVPVMDEKSCYAVARTRDTSVWEPEILSYYSSIYGEEKFSELWKNYVDFIIATLELPERFDIRENLYRIKCPVWILHGSKDPIVSFKDHVKPIENQIYNSEIIQFKGLAHNIHQADPERFNQVLTRLVDSVSVV